MHVTLRCKWGAYETGLGYMHTCYVHAHMHPHTHAYTHACMHRHIRTYVHTHTHTHTHTYMHACMHTYIHTSIYIYMSLRPLGAFVLAELKVDSKIAFFI